MKAKFSLITVLTLMVLALQVNIAVGNDSYWSLDAADIDGNIVKDIWDGKDGEITGAPQIVNGKMGEALQFNGVDEFITVSALNMSPSVYPEITLTAWVYPTSDGTGGQANRRFLFGHDDGGWDRGLLIEGTQWRLGTGDTYWDTGVSVEVGSWQHVAMVYDSSDIKFYMNGAESSYGSPGVLGDGNDFLLIGTHPSQARYFEGIIDEIYAYDSALSLVEIEENMEGTVPSRVEADAKLSTTWAEIKVVK
jgi:hypothetical protein